MRNIPEAHPPGKLGSNDDITCRGEGALFGVDDYRMQEGVTVVQVGRSRRRF